MALLTGPSIFFARSPVAVPKLERTGPRVRAAYPNFISWSPDF